jgi:hypothetical protein
MASGVGQLQVATHGLRVHEHAALRRLESGATSPSVRWHDCELGQSCAGMFHPVDNGHGA